jgi:hypothetical protein
VPTVESQSDGDFPHYEGQPGVDPTRPKVSRPGHTLENIRTALEGVAAPLTFAGPDQMTGYDVFAGYMVLDALIANRDRHEQNWAIVAPQLTSAPERLAPSYDHSGSLGYNLAEPRRSALLVRAGGVEAWAVRGTAYRFEHLGSSAPTLVDHAARAVALCTQTGAAWWRDRLEHVTLGSVHDALAECTVPGMSEAACTFASNLLNVNLRRLRDAIG